MTTADISSSNDTSGSRRMTPPEVALTSLHKGDRGVLHGVDLHPDEEALLQALGLGSDCMFKLCKAGNPWILQVRGTRIGLAEEIACRLTVTPASATPTSVTPASATPNP